MKPKFKLPKNYTAREVLEAVMPEHEFVLHSLASVERGTGVVVLGCSCETSIVFSDEDCERALGVRVDSLCMRLGTLGRAPAFA